MIADFVYKCSARHSKMQLDASICSIMSRGPEIWVVWITQVPHNSHPAELPSDWRRSHFLCYFWFRSCIWPQRASRANERAGHWQLIFLCFFFSLRKQFSTLLFWLKCNGIRTAQWRIQHGRRMGSTEISEMVWMLLPPSRRDVVLKLLIKTETSYGLFYWKAEKTTTDFFPHKYKAEILCKRREC